jgi:aminocarboxymuconate-semialdehyde decarboxylase
MEARMNIDIHTHVIPLKIIEQMRCGNRDLQASVQRDAAGKEWICHDQGFRYPLVPQYYDVTTRIKDMDRAKLDLGVLSVAPTLFYYWTTPTIGANISKVTNDVLADMVRQRPDRFRALGTIPMQDIPLAIEELDRCIKELGFCGIQIGSNIEGVQLDDPRFAPIFARSEELDTFIFIHPYYIGDKYGFGKYYLINLIGNPLETTIAISHIIFGGLLEKYPKLKLCFAHAGGFFPYQRGRLEHGYQVREEGKVVIKHPPSHYVPLIYYDTITHFGPSLAFLAKTVGQDRIMIGTDYPFDMGVEQPVDFVESVSGLSAKAKKDIKGRNAMRILGL